MWNKPSRIPALLLASLLLSVGGGPSLAAPAAGDAPGLGGTPADATPPARPPAAKPPRAKSPAEQAAKARAQKLSAEAINAWNAYEYVTALDKLRAAYKLYPDHTLLYNIGLVNQSLGRYVQALKAFEQFIQRARDSPAYAAAVEKARERAGSLGNRVGTVRIKVGQKGARVLLDRRALGLGPVDRKARVMPGIHVLVVSLKGHVTRTVTFGVAAGRKREIAVRLAPIPVKVVRTRLTRRFPRWLPWTVLGAGALVAVLGGPVTWKAKHDFDALDEEIRALNEANGGQPVALSEDLRDTRTRARVAYGFSIGMYTVGALGIAAGITMAILNRPRAENPGGGSPDAGPGTRLRVRFVPTLAPNGGGASVTLTW